MQSDEQLLARNARGRVTGPAWLRLMASQKPTRQRAFIVLLVSLPLWVYAVAAASFTLEANGEISLEQLLVFVAGRLLVFPALYGIYLLALSIPNGWVKQPRYWLLQLVLAFGFLTLMYPVLIALNTLAFGSYVQPNLLAALLHGDFQDAMAPFLSWRNWTETSLELSEIYLLGLALMLALSAFLRFKAEQMLTTELHSKWLEAQLATLRDQIGPHFLFNALNTILALIRDEPAVAEKMTIELGELLRHNLDRSEQEYTTVADELQFIERYLTIMKMRFEERLEVLIEVDPRVLTFNVPAFLFLPMVENAIKHGVAKFPGLNRIEIHGGQTDGLLSFRFNNLYVEPQAEAPVSQRRGVGLANARNRLAAIYGTRAEFSAGPDGRGRWVTAITLPIT